MGRKTFSAPVHLSGSSATATVLEVSSAGLDSNSATFKAVLDASGDLISQSVGGQKVALGPWIDDNLVTNQTVLKLSVSQVATVPDISVPYAGSVIGLTLNLQTHMTAGTLKAWATKNGVTVATVVVNATTAVGALAFTTTQAKDVTTLAAGDRVGVAVSTSTTYAPTSNDPVLTVWVEQ
jgi:hypothetical protein